MLNIQDPSKLFFTSDTHLQHAREFVWKTRGFSSVKEHDDSIIVNINDKVKPDDYLFHIGDFCLNTTTEQFEAFISRINCKNIYMLWGNHPNPHYKNIYKPIIKQRLGEQAFDDTLPPVEMYPIRYKNVVYLGHYAEAILGGQFVVLCHYPLSIWNEMQHGAWHLCGHSHYGFAQSKADNLYGKILDVGVDGHEFKPWSFEEISAVMDGKRFIPIDHHK